MDKENTPSIKALKAGDRDAYAQMVELYSPKIYRLALRMVDDPHEAEDILQETFLNAFRAIEQFEGRSSLGTWLYRIAANQALMHLRNKSPTLVSVDELIPSLDDPDQKRELADWCCLPEDEFMTTEAQAMLKDAIQDLSPTLKTVFILRDLHHLTTRETAQVLDISESALKTRLLRARLQLRDSLSSYFSERVKEIDND